MVKILYEVLIPQPIRVWTEYTLTTPLAVNVVIYGMYGIAFVSGWLLSDFLDNISYWVCTIHPTFDIIL